MRLRAIVPGILAVMMLCSSGVVDACALVPALAGAAVSCGHGGGDGMEPGQAQMPEAMGAMPGAHRCPMCKSTLVAVNGLQTASCCRDACAGQPDAARMDGGDRAWMADGLVAMRWVVPVSPASRYARVAIPSLRSASVAPFPLILRV